MGMTPFETDILLRGSYTYLDHSCRRRYIHATCGSGTRSPVTLTGLRFVWLFRVMAGRGCWLSRFRNGSRSFRRSLNSYFSNCCISSMIGILRQNY